MAARVAWRTAEREVLIIMNPQARGFMLVYNPQQNEIGTPCRFMVAAGARTAQRPRGTSSGVTKQR